MDMEAIMRESLEGKFFHEHTHVSRLTAHEIAVLSDVARKRGPRPKASKPVRAPISPEVDPLLRAVCTLWGVPYEDFHDRSRSEAMLNARTHFVGELKKRTGASFHVMGKMIGHDHSYVRHYLLRYEKDVPLYEEMSAKLAEAGA